MLSAFLVLFSILHPSKPTTIIVSNTNTPSSGDYTIASNIFQALVKAKSLDLTNDEEISILLSKGDHYILPIHMDASLSSVEANSASPSGYQYGSSHSTFFGSVLDGRIAANLIIRPLLISESPPELVQYAVSGNTTVRIIPKVHLFHFRFFQDLTIKNIVFDGSDLLIWRDCNSVVDSNCKQNFLNKEEVACIDPSLHNKGQGCQLCQHYDGGHCSSFDETDSLDEPSDQLADKFNTFLSFFILDATLGQSVLPDDFSLDSDWNESLLKNANKSVSLPRLKMVNVSFLNWLHQPVSLINFKTNGILKMVDVEMKSVNSRYGVITTSFNQLAMTGEQLSPIKHSIDQVDQEYWQSHTAAISTMTLTTKEYNQFSCLLMDCYSQISISSGNFIAVEGGGVLRLVDYLGSVTIDATKFDSTSTSLENGPTSLYSGGGVNIEGVLTSFILTRSEFTQTNETINATINIFQNTNALTLASSLTSTNYTPTRQSPTTSYIIFDTLIASDNITYSSITHLTITYTTKIVYTNITLNNNTSHPTSNQSGGISSFFGYVESSLVNSVPSSQEEQILASYGSKLTDPYGVVVDKLEVSNCFRPVIGQVGGRLMVKESVFKENFGDFPSVYLEKVVKFEGIGVGFQGEGGKIAVVKGVRIGFFNLVSATFVGNSGEGTMVLLEDCEGDVVIVGNVWDSNDGFSHLLDVDVPETKLILESNSLVGNRTQQSLMHFTEKKNTTTAIKIIESTQFLLNRTESCID